MTERKFENIKGFDALDKTLKELPEKIGRNIMRAGLRAGAGVIRDEAKVQLQTNGSVQTGELRDGMKIGSQYKDGVARGYCRLGGKHAFIGPWLEYGTAAHGIMAKNAKWLFFGGAFLKSVTHPGSKPKPFLRPALEGKAQAALQAVGDMVKKRLNKQGLNTPDVIVGDEELP